MAKSFIILCTVFLISAAFGATDLEAAKEACKKSITEAGNDGRHLYENLPTEPHVVNNAAQDVYMQGMLDLEDLIGEVERATTMEVTTKVKSAFEEHIQCSDDIAQRVRDITVEMRDGLTNED